MEMNLSKLPAALLNELRCRDCRYYLSVAGVKILSDGSAICGRCRARTGTPSETYEALASFFSYPCKYRYNGCSKIVTWTQVGLHEKGCSYRPGCLCCRHPSTLCGTGVKQLSNEGVTPVVANSQVQSKLKCGSCGKFLSTTPIYIAPDGTDICHTCGPNAAAILARNTPLETILNAFVFECKHKASGCNGIFSFSAIAVHESDCSYGKMYKGYSEPQYSQVSPKVPQQFSPKPTQQFPPQNDYRSAYYNNNNNNNNVRQHRGYDNYGEDYRSFDNYEQRNDYPRVHRQPQPDPYQDPYTNNLNDPWNDREYRPIPRESFLKRRSQHPNVMQELDARRLNEGYDVYENRYRRNEYKQPPREMNVRNDYSRRDLQPERQISVKSDYSQRSRQSEQSYSDNNQRSRQPEPSYDREVPRALEPAAAQAATAANNVPKKKGEKVRGLVNTPRGQIYATITPNAIIGYKAPEKKEDVGSDSGKAAASREDYDYRDTQQERPRGPGINQDLLQELKLRHPARY